MCLWKLQIQLLCKAFSTCKCLWKLQIQLQIHMLKIVICSKYLPEVHTGQGNEKCTSWPVCRRHSFCSDDGRALGRAPHGARIGPKATRSKQRFLLNRWQRSVRRGLLQANKVSWTYCHGGLMEVRRIACFEAATTWFFNHAKKRTTILYQQHYQ